MTILKLNLLEKIYLSYEKYKSDKMEAFLLEHHKSLDSKFLNKNSMLNFLAFKLIDTNDSDLFLTDLIKHDEEDTPAFKWHRNQTGIDYILQGKYQGYYLCFRVSTKKNMRFFARFLENTFLEKLAIEKIFQVSTNTDLIYIKGMAFNGFTEHQDKLLNIMNELNIKKQEQEQGN
jgi:hypothetical protein